MFPQGSKYTGDWLNDLQSGKGTEEWSDGATYTGQYMGGRKNGKGPGFRCCRARVKWVDEVESLQIPDVIVLRIDR